MTKVPVYRELVESWRRVRRELSCMCHLLSELRGAHPARGGDASARAR